MQANGPKFGRTKLNSPCGVLCFDIEVLNYSLLKINILLNLYTLFMLITAFKCSCSVELAISSSIAQKNFLQYKQTDSKLQMLRIALVIRINYSRSSFGNKT